jgi:Fur family ferric uptake transcriptional regulator
LVLTAIAEMGGHVTVDRIHRRVLENSPQVDLATVYRTVGLLKRLHVLNEIVSGGVSHYELPDPDHRHHHMVCEHCGKAIHLQPKYLDGLRELLLRETGFEPHMEHFNISGLCADCRADTAHSHSGHSHSHTPEEMEGDELAIHRHPQES